MPIRRLPQLHLNLDGTGNLHQQVYRALRKCIAQGRIKPSARLPSSRALATDLNVSRTTTQLAFDQLLAEGYLTSKQGAGTYVTAKLHRPQTDTRHKQASAINWSSYAQNLHTNSINPAAFYERSGRFDFRMGIPDASAFPHKAWMRTLKQYLSADLNKAADTHPAGIAVLRQAISAYLFRSRGIRCNAEQIIITSGTSQSLQLLSRALCNPAQGKKSGDSVLIEEPCYPIAKQTFRAEGLSLLSAAVDLNGINLSELDPAEKINMIYLTPSHQFPLGAVLSAQRRKEVIDLAHKHHAIILEDDYDGEFRYHGRPIEPLYNTDTQQQVIYLGSFSKSLTPLIRLGYMLVPDSMIETLRLLRWYNGAFNATPDQYALAKLIEDGHYEKQIRRMKLRYARRRQRLLSALDKHLGPTVNISGENAGLHLVIWLDIQATKKNRLALMSQLKNAGLLTDLVNDFYEHPTNKIGLVLGYGAIAEEDIETGIAALSKCIKTFK